MSPPRPEALLSKFRMPAIVSSGGGTGVNGAARSFYVRPAGTTYGTGDGLSYANAVAGLSNIPWSRLHKTADILWICGVHYERLTPLTSIKGFSSDQRLQIRCDYLPDIGIIDGSVSFDGSHTVNPAATYDGTPSSWANLSGEIWYKTTTRCPYGMFEDGRELTPIVLNWSNEKSNEYVTANLARGQFGWFASGTANADGSGGAVSNRLYYRASDGANPNTHSLYCCSQSYNALAPALFDGCQYLYLYIYTRRWRTNTVSADVPALNIRSSTDIKIDGIIEGNLIACRSYRNTTVEFLPTFVVRDNIFDGLFLENTGGTDSGYTISGTYKRNGRSKLYTGTTYLNGGDSDSIGIGGGSGGSTFSGIVVQDSYIEDSGPGPASSVTTNITTVNTSTSVTVTSTDLIQPGMHVVASGVPVGATVSSITSETVFVLSAAATASATVSGVFEWAKGANVYVGTVGSNTIGVTVRRSILKGSTTNGIFCDGTDWVGGDIYSNIVIDAGLPSGSYKAQGGISVNAGIVSQTSVVRNNTIVRCRNYFGMYVKGHASTDMAVNNNCFYDCGDTSGWRADLWVDQTNRTHIVDKNNHWYKTTYTSSKAIEWNLVTYVTTDIPATYQAANTNSSGNITGNPNLANPTTGVAREDFMPASGAILKAAGLAIANSDYLDALKHKNANANPDIGALWLAA